MKFRITAALPVLLLAMVGATAAAGEAAPNAQSVQPLETGMLAPTFMVITAAGEPLEINPAETGKRQLLIFYRGGWCPYCNRHLKALRNVVPRLRAADIEVLFLSADRPEILYSSLDEPDIDYTLLSDASQSAARAFGLAFRVDDDLVERYKTYGIDLEAASGFDHHQLPVPAVYLLDADGRVAFMFADPDYKVRLEPDAILKAAGL